MPAETDECCGNGCVNCILDAPAPLKEKEVDGKRNILAQYHKYELLTKAWHNVTTENEVLEMHFRAFQAGENDEYSLQLPAGHHVMLRVSLPEEGEKKHLRPYSPFWRDKHRLEFKILVNLKPQGNMSRYLATMQPGETAEFRGPIGVYAHTATATKRELLIITQGVAIAPALPIIEQVLENEDDMSRITHFACYQDLQHLYFRERLREYNRFWNYRSRSFLAHHQCAVDKCSMPAGDCEHFRRSLCYKEEIEPRRLSDVDVCEVAAAASTVVISGARAFQDAVAKWARQLPGEQEVFLL